MARGSILERNSGNGGYLLPVLKISAAKSLDAIDDSGKVFIVANAGSAYSISLPTTLEVGTQYKLIFEDSPNAAVTIAAGSAIMFGKIGEAEVDTSDDAPGSAGSTGVSNVIFGTTADEGDHIDIVCDGTKWYFNGMAAVDGAVTTS
tara:strand:+ start:240 stop:680 length:441 start_codon:yes stop_codon:yes gene_type:complete